MTMSKENDYYADENGFRRDIVERSSEYQKISRQVEKEVKEALAKKRILPGMLGYCQAFWSEKKKILKEKYGINWRSPQEMNPEISFD